MGFRFLGEFMLELVNLTKIYKTRAGNTAALDNLSLVLPDAGMVFITGRSGSGKTTLLNVVGALDGFDSGDIIVDGKNFSSFSHSDYAKYRNTVLGFVFQEYNLLPDYTVERNITLANELQGKKTTKEEVDSLLEVVDLKGLNNRKPSELSGGQKQRVAIARALIKQPRIIMADEPTGALDQATGIQVMDTLKKLSKTKLIIVVSHDMEMAEKYADRIIRLVDGKLAEDVTLTDKNIDTNVYDDEQVFHVKKGSSLSSEETEILVKGIAKNKKIQFFDKDYVRLRHESEPLDPKTSNNKSLTLVSSKMKRRSSMAIGVKALGVKPIRLILTILFSVFAFALFGLFDSLYNFSQTRVIADMISDGNFPSITASARYSDRGINSQIRTSQNIIDELNQVTGYNFRGLYEIDDASPLGVGKECQIIQPDLSNAPSNGKLYYYQVLNDYVEFDSSEITGEGVVGDVIDPQGFNLKIVAGKFPSLPQPDEDGVYYKNSFQNVAISEYMAESLLFWLKASQQDYYTFTTMNGNKFSKRIKTIEDLIEVPIYLSNDRNRPLYINAIIDCGDIPTKYDSLKTKLPSSNVRILAEDMVTYLDSGLFLKVFVPKGYVNTLRNHYYYDNMGDVLHHERATKYFTSSVNTTVNGISLKADNYTHTAFYKANNYIKTKDNGDKYSDNIIMFKDNFNGEVSLNKKDIIINIKDFEKYYKQELRTAEYTVDFASGYGYWGKDYYKQDLKGVLQAFQRKSVNTLVKDDNRLTLMKDVTLATQLSNSDITQQFDCRIVGVYFGLDSDITTPGEISAPYPLMITSSLMSDMGICVNQDMYARVISPATTNPESIQALAKVFTLSKGIKFIWFGNTILNTLNANQQTLDQVMNILLYIAIALASFSVFMLFNYISVSILSRRRSVGVLKGLGSNNRNIFRIFFTESLIIAIINGAIACLTAWVGCSIVNTYIQSVMGLSISFAIYTLRQVILIMGASIVTAIVSSLIPIIKICREKPVQLIRKP